MISNICIYEVRFLNNLINHKHTLACGYDWVNEIIRVKLATEICWPDAYIGTLSPCWDFMFANHLAISSLWLV